MRFQEIRSQAPSLRSSRITDRREKRERGNTRHPTLFSTIKEWVNIMKPSSSLNATTMGETIFFILRYCPLVLLITLWIFYWYIALSGSLVA
jgi:hypothetical protein